MALNCPNYALSDVLADWNEIARKLGEDKLPRDRRPKTLKLWMDSKEDTRLALQRLNPAAYSSQSKRDKLVVQSQSVHFDPSNHLYKIGNKEIPSVSRKLDEEENLVYGGDEKGQLYSQKGSDFHQVIQDTVNGVNRENILAFAGKRGIPENFVNFAAGFISSLTSDGSIVMAETRLLGRDNSVAGTADLIHLKNDGTIDLYDLKTAFLTPTKAASGKRAWDPIGDFNSRKAHRYGTQLEYYARMIEDTVGHPVSNSYIVPVEISFTNNIPTSSYDKVTPLEKENTEKYGYSARSREIVDKTFHIERSSPLPPLAIDDDSSKLISDITGTIQSVNSSLEEQAAAMLVEGSPFKDTIGGFHGYRKDGKFVRFHNQTDRSAQKQQIITEYLSRQEKSFADIAPTIKNYISTGESKFLEASGKNYENIRQVLDSYKNQGYDVHDLNEIKGFESKKGKGWFLIKKDDKADLLYIGNENLSQKFSVYRKSSFVSRAFGADHSLFGNLGFSLQQAKYELDSSLQNTLGAAKQLESTLIALKLKEADPSIKFDRILMMSLAQSSSVALNTQLSETLPIVQKLLSHPEAKRYFPPSFASIVANKALFDETQYEQDYLKGWHDVLGDIITKADNDLSRGIDAFQKQQLSKEQLMEKIAAAHSSVYMKADPQSKQKALALSQMHRQLSGLHKNLTSPITLFESLGSMPTNIKNEIFQNVVTTFKNSIANVRREFFQNYKKPFNEKIRALFSSSSTVFDKFADYSISNTTKYYERLTQKQEYTVKKMVDGQLVTSKVKLTNFNLIAEGSEAFKALTKEEQDVITSINDAIQRSAKAMKIEWVRGRLPLMRSSFYNKLYKAISGEGSGYNGLLQRAFDDMEGNFATGIPDEAPDKSGKLYNRFMDQRNADDSDPRTAMLGITPDGEINPELHSQFETNLEVVSDMFVMEAIRVHEFNKANQVFQMADTLFQWFKSGLLDKGATKLADFLNIWQQAQIHQRNTDAGTIQSKTVSSLNKVVSLSLITKPSVALWNWISQETLIFTQAMANSLGNRSDFGIKEWTQAGAIIAKAGLKRGGNKLKLNDNSDMEKIDLMMEEYGLFNLSYSDMINGHRREGNKSLFRLKNLYMGLNAGDWACRARVIIAQTLKHDSWNAYSVENGKLVYDEKLDGRFNGTSLEIEKGRALKAATKAELELEGGVNENGSLKRGYGQNEALYLKNLADTLVGSLDRDSKAGFAFNSWGNLFGLFKGWMPPRLNALFDSKFTSKIMGSYQFVPKEDGTYDAVWTGKQMEGIAQTLLYGAWYMAQYRKNPFKTMTPHQLSNMNQMLVQGIVVAIVSAAALALQGDEEDDEDKNRRKMMSDILLKSISDTISIYNVKQLSGFIYTPISVVYGERLYKQVWNIASGKKDINEGITDITTRIPLINYWPDLKKVIDNEDADPDTK